MGKGDRVPPKGLRNRQSPGRPATARRGKGRSLIRRILCPTDFSKTSLQSLEYAAALARQLRAEVTVLHVVPFWPSIARYPSLVDPIILMPRVRDEMLTELRRFAHPAFRGTKPKALIREGDPVDEILKATVRADLIVMGTHGRRGFERWAMGSVTEGVLHRAPCAVLTGAFRGPDVTKVPRVRRILCAVDFSGASLRALRFALSLAKNAKAQVTLLHVVEWAPGDEFPRYVHYVDMTDYRRFLEGQALRRLRKAAPAFAQTLRREEVVTAGKPHQEILRVAQSKRADLIVLGVHGRSGIDLAFFGSTANRVVRDSACPVLTVRGRSARRNRS